MNYQNHKDNFEGHRIWHFINQARRKGQDSIEFYRPTGKLANIRYSALTEKLNSMGYKTNDLTTEGSLSLVSILVVSNIQKGFVDVVGGTQ